jgi:hypothetical protein
MQKARFPSGHIQFFYFVFKIETHLLLLVQNITILLSFGEGVYKDCNAGRLKYSEICCPVFRS